MRDGLTRRVLLGCVERMGADVRRLRNRCDPESSLYWVGERLASEIEVVDTCLWPSAGQLVAWSCPGDDDAVAEALAIVDARQREVWALLGGRPNV